MIQNGLAHKIHLNKFLTSLSIVSDLKCFFLLHSPENFNLILKTKSFSLLSFCFDILQLNNSGSFLSAPSFKSSCQCKELTVLLKLTAKSTVQRFEQENYFNITGMHY